MKRVLLVFLSLTSLMLTACGREAKDSITRTNKSYSYRYSVVGSCDTGLQTAPDLDSLCSVLVDEAKNHYCGTDYRREMFRTRGCIGAFSTKLSTPESAPAVSSYVDLTLESSTSVNSVTAAGLNVAVEIRCSAKASSNQMNDLGPNDVVLIPAQRRDGQVTSYTEITCRP